MMVGDPCTMYGNLSRPLYVSLHSLWQVYIRTYVAGLLGAAPGER